MRYAARLLPAAALFALIAVLPAALRAQGESPYPVLTGTVGPATRFISATRPGTSWPGG
jgi:hypothetical protein